METITGTIEQIYHHSPKGFLIASIEPQGHKVVGVLEEAAVGNKMEFYGEWEDNEQYGRQFRFQSAVLDVPKTKQDMLRFMGMLKHIGPVRAFEIMTRFGDSIFEVLDNSPQKLCAIAGISPERAEMVASSWNRIRSDKEKIFFLDSMGCTPVQRKMIINHYREKTIEVLKENPYRILQDIVGFGFRTVDKFALKLGLGCESPRRAEAVLVNVLLEASRTEQHTYLPESELLKTSASDYDISRQKLLEALVRLTKNSVIIRNLEGKWCALSTFEFYESNIAEKLKELMSFKSSPDKMGDIPATYKDPVTGQTISLNEKQMKAVQMAYRNNVSIITGLPGTGKTTLLKAILHIFQHCNISLASPTGKAAKRMEEATGIHASTIHRMLGYDAALKGFSFNADNPLPADIIIVDEISMIDAYLMNALLLAIAPGTKVILVGDADQLPSVGPGNVLSDMLSSGNIPSIKLTQIMRQAAESIIIKNAHRINRGLPIDIKSKKDFFFIDEDDEEFIPGRIKKLVAEEIPQKFELDPIYDIQVLCPQNVGNIGSKVFNRKLQRSLNPPQEEKNELKIGENENSYILRVGDRVIQNCNNYYLGVFNGATGIVVHVDSEDGKIWVDFNNWQKSQRTVDQNYKFPPANYPKEHDSGLIMYNQEYLAQLKLAYAISIHKSQGSEFPSVVIPIHKTNRIMLQRNLLYTAITRGKKYVFIVGSEKAIDYCIDNDVPTRRYTNLQRFIKEQF